MPELTPEEKITFIENQIMFAEMGAEYMKCPYCHQDNMRGQALCCDSFAMAAMAIIDRQDINAKLEELDQIAEKVAKN